MATDPDPVTTALTDVIAPALGWRMVPHTASIDRGTSVFLSCEIDRPAIVFELIGPAIGKCLNKYVFQIGNILRATYVGIEGTSGEGISGSAVADTEADATILAAAEVLPKLIEGGWRP